MVLGCAGMAGLCAWIHKEVGAPVVDGVAAATALVEAMVRLGVPGASRGELAAPRPKRYTGLLETFTVA